MSPRAKDFRVQGVDHEWNFTGHARAWHAEGEPETHGGETIHVRRRVGGAPLMLLLHGLPGSSFDWRFVLAGEREHAAVTFDYLGLGCSSKPAQGEYSLGSMADLADRFVDEHGQGRPVLIVAHDLGVAVAAELLTRAGEGRLEMEAAGALLINGAIEPGPAARRFATTLLSRRFGGERRFASRLAKAFSPEHPLAKEEAADQYSLLSYEDGDKRGAQLLGYLDDAAAGAARRREGLASWPGEVRALWGREDPIAGAEALAELRALREGLQARELEGIGHYPQIEVPDQVVTAIRDSIAAVSASHSA